MKIRKEFKFTLPVGYPDKEGKFTKVRGIMRLIKVKDLISIYQDTRVKENEAYFYVILLTRVVTKLGDARMVTTKTIENLSPRDFAFLVDFMNEINHKVIKSIPIKCSNCDNMYIGEFSLLGEH